ncbi:MAG TPA: response regulator [Chloroflexota bacterium]|nr:response regulator [Chloroflexota bacterium]
MEKVLLVDDDSWIRQLVATTLNDGQWAISESAAGLPALDFIHREHPRLVILDLGLPDISGLEVCRQVKGDPRLRDTMVIILTANTDTRELAACQAVGADAILNKPFSPLRLLTLVESVTLPSSLDDDSRYQPLLAEADLLTGISPRQ